MLGIVPGTSNITMSQQSNGGGFSSDEESNSANSPHENRLGFIKRLKSFRKSTVRRSQGREKVTLTASPNAHYNVSLKDKLPAKYIQTTDVKTATLNPVWMEKFRL